MNTISDILHSMRLTGGVFLEAEFTAPWSIEAQVTHEDCSAYMQTPREIIAYHLITAGRCLIMLKDGHSMQLKRGDLVLLPRNTPHILATGPEITPVPADRLIQKDPNGGVARIAHGGGQERTQVLCGFLGSATENVCLAALLPEALKLGSEDWPAAPWIETTFRFAVQESARRQADSREAVARLAELLFLEAVRRYFALHPRAQEAALAGMHDNQVGRALVLMHKHLYQPWSTESLARQIGLSRSSFADRFSRASRPCAIWHTVGWSRRRCDCWIPLMRSPALPTRPDMSRNPPSVGLSDACTARRRQRGVETWRNPELETPAGHAHRPELLPGLRCVIGARRFQRFTLAAMRLTRIGRQAAAQKGQLRITREAAHGREHSQHETMAAIEEPAAHQVNTDERPHAVAQRRTYGGLSTLCMHHVGRVAGIAIHFLYGEGQIRVRVMKHVRLEAAHVTLGHDPFMHGGIGETRLPAAEQSQHGVGPPTAMTDEFAAKTGKPRDFIRYRFCGAGHRALDLRRKLWRNAFIGIERQYPLTLRQRQRPILLPPESRPIGRHFDAGAGGTGNCNSIVGAA